MVKITRRTWVGIILASVVLVMSLYGSLVFSVAGETCEDKGLFTIQPTTRGASFEQIEIDGLTCWAQSGTIVSPTNDTLADQTQNIVDRIEESDTVLTIQETTGIKPIVSTYAIILIAVFIAITIGTMVYLFIRR